jgi:hypothetical protein
VKKSLILIAILAPVLSGCLATLEGKMENRITTTLPCDRAFLASLYGPFGLTAEIDKKDVAMLPCAGRVAPAPAAAASAAK